ncbi:MAG: TonB-dependent receptor [Gammaproteobacteria bacterium]|nr:TonB-dependent receptor [Gammaproteobacteria bacterium]
MNGNPSRLRAIAAGIATALLPLSPAHAMDEVLVTATRVERNVLDLPFSVSTVAQDDVQSRQLIGLDESMARVPGVFITDRYNYGRDLRISIRGFGARSNFGIRGLRVYVDGIPATAPDGQTALDDLDLVNVSRIEVIRGPASALYGSSAGGVINIFTEDGPETPYAEVGASRGSYDFGRYHFKTGGQSGPLNYFVSGSWLDYDGFRRNADIENRKLNSKFAYNFADGSVGHLIVRYADAPDELDPGGLNAALVAADRGGARPQQIQYDAGEKVEDTKVAWSWEKDLGVHEFTVRNYYNWRDFYGRLPFQNGGISAFERFFFGGGAQYSNSTALAGHANRITLGLDADHMTDERTRNDNLNGAEGPLTLAEDQTADTVGIYLQNEFNVNEHIDLQAALRYDHARFEIDDKFLADGDQSGVLKFNEITWNIGGVWHLFPGLNPYANYGTAFETPTFTEYAQATQLGGFANVAPQRTRGWEAGFKGALLERLRYDFAYYSMNVEDEVATVANFNGRAFFNNADTDRHGIEVSMVAGLLDGLDLTVSYTHSDLEFDTFKSNVPAEGNALPGVPSNFGYIELDYHHDCGFYAKWDWQFVGSLYADNLNTTKVEGYDVSNIVVGYDYQLGQVTLSPSFGVNNLFNQKYNTDIRIEDNFRRYFEPAPGRNIFGMLRVRYTFGT